MSLPQVNVEPEVGNAASPVAFTPAARHVLAGARAEGGDVCVVLSWPGGAVSLPECHHQSSEFELVLGRIDGCPIYVDSRHLALLLGQRVPLRIAGMSHHNELRQQVRRPAMARCSLEDDLTAQLALRFSGRCEESAIRNYVRAAITDLTGSVSDEALPEMSDRLANHRLAAATQATRHSFGRGQIIVETVVENRSMLNWPAD